MRTYTNIEDGAKALRMLGHITHEEEEAVYAWVAEQIAAGCTVQDAYTSLEFGGTVKAAVRRMAERIAREKAKAGCPQGTR